MGHQLTASQSQSEFNVQRSRVLLNRVPTCTPDQLLPRGTPPGFAKNTHASLLTPTGPPRSAHPPPITTLLCDPSRLLSRIWTAPVFKLSSSTRYLFPLTTWQWSNIGRRGPLLARPSSIKHEVPFSPPAQPSLPMGPLRPACLRNTSGEEFPILTAHPPNRWTLCSLLIPDACTVHIEGPRHYLKIHIFFQMGKVASPALNWTVTILQSCSNSLLVEWHFDIHYGLLFPRFPRFMHANLPLLACCAHSKLNPEII